MFDAIGKPFFAALARAAAAHLAPDDPLLTALRAAADTAAPEAIGTAQARLAALPEGPRASILAAAHAALRLDPTLVAGGGLPVPDRSGMH